MPEKNKKLLNWISAVFLVTMLSFTQVAAAATAKKEKDPGAMTIDALVARPVGLVATLAGTAVFVVSLPFSAIGGNSEEAWDRLVVSPAEYTFKRELGDFEE